jgi:hypothetical protein
VVGESTELIEDRLGARGHADGEVVRVVRYREAEVEETVRGLVLKGEEDERRVALSVG